MSLLLLCIHAGQATNMQPARSMNWSTMPLCAPAFQDDQRLPVMLLMVGCLASQQHVGVSQGRVCTGEQEGWSILLLFAHTSQGGQCVPENRKT